MRQLKITQSITNRESSSIEMYMNEVGKYEMIDIEKETQLAERIHNGDSEAVNELVKANLRFVISVAKQYQNQGLTLPDLINEGNLGLIKAAKKFDETKGFKFISYAVWWIRQTIMEALNQQGRMVRLPLNQIGLISKTNKYINKFESENGRQPRIDEISDYTDISEENLRVTFRVSTKHISYDLPFDETGEGNLLDVIEDKDSPSADADVMKTSITQDIERAIQCLDSRQRLIVVNYYGIGTTEKMPEDISRMLGISRERVRQLLNLSIRKLKKNTSLKQYLN